LIAACIFLPAFVMGFVGGWMCDKFGRRWVVWGGSVIIIIGAIFNGLSQSVGQFMGGEQPILRF
jgi:MFS family permease